MIEGVETPLTLNTSILKSFLEEQRLPEMLKDTETLELHFLTLENVSISYNEVHFITKLSCKPLPAPAPASPVTMATRLDTASPVSLASPDPDDLTDIFSEDM